MDKRPQKTSSSLGFVFKGIFGASVIQSGLRMIINQLDSAIQIIYIINNFPNITQNLGLSAEDSSLHLKNK